jgi:type IV pilus assembly protein PilB
MKKERIGQIFVKAGLLTEEELKGVLEENRKTPEEKLGETLVRLNFASDTEVARALSFKLGIPYIDLNTVVVDPYAIRRIPLKLAMQKQILPVYLEKNGLILAMNDPQDFEALETSRTWCSRILTCPRWMA